MEANPEIPRLFCRQYVGKAEWVAPISLQDKELRKQSKWLLTTGSVVQIRAGELESPSIRMGFFM